MSDFSAAVFDLIRTAPRPLGRRDVARALDLPPEKKRELIEALRDLVRDGRIALGPGRRFVATAATPELAAVEVVRIDRDGHAIGRVLDAKGEIVLRNVQLLPGPGPAPGKGDRVLARLARGKDGGWTARTQRKLDDAPASVVGVFEAAAHGPGGTIRPADRRVKSVPFVPASEAAGLKPGDLVRAELIQDRQFGPPRARIVERLGRADAPDAVSVIAIHQHGIPTEFPPEALAEAEKPAPVSLDGRADLRALPLVTVDGADARDFDDAVFAEADQGGGFRIAVAIADVAYYVRPGSALDREAKRRGNSVYFPDRVVPMLPERLSNDLCSLKPDEDRACLVAHMRISAEGKLLGHRFERAVMRSAARLTYERAQRMADGTEDAPPGLMERSIRPLYAAYRALDRARRERATLDLDLPERKVEIGADGRIARIAPVQRLDSHKLIEEFMIAANVAAAETLEARRQPCMYRIHDPPDPAKLETLRPVIKELGYPLPPQGLQARHFNRLIEASRGTPHQRLIHEMVLRSQMQAAYAPDNRGHFGLALARYAHFTSPIRRYADLLVHRSLIGPGRPDGIGGPAAADWDEAGEHISATERRAMAAERDAYARYLAHFMSGRVGAEFAATISGAAKFGLFVTLAETGADGLVPMRALGDDYFQHDAERQAVVGTRTGRIFRLGDAVTVRLAQADGLTGSLTFEIAEHEPSGRPSGTAPAGRGAPRRGPKGGRYGPRRGR